MVVARVGAIGWPVFEHRLQVCSLQQPDFVSKAVKPEWRVDAQALLVDLRSTLQAHAT